MEAAADRHLKSLRRTFTPYIGLMLILSGVTVFSIWVVYKTSQWGLLWSMAVIWPLTAFAYGYFGWKYRILWDETGLFMQASGGPERHFLFDEIVDVRVEVAGVSELASQSRPFRRIVVYKNKRSPTGFIDISLRHFRLDDVRELLEEVQRRRPDLSVPILGADGRVSTHATNKQTGR